MELEPRDKQLIALLKKNGRESVVSLSKKLGVSRATVQNRIETLERRKVIKGFTVLFDDEYDNRLLRVLISITLQAGTARTVIEQLRPKPEVTRMLSVSGTYDLVIELTVENTVELDKQIAEIREIEGIKETITSIILADYD